MFFHWTLEIHLRLPSINELDSTSQFPNIDVERLKETQKQLFTLFAAAIAAAWRQYLVWPPFALITAFTRRGMDSISISSRRWGMPRHTSVTAQLQTRKKRKNPKSLPGPSNKTMIPRIDGRRTRHTSNECQKKKDLGDGMAQPVPGPESAGEFVALHESSSEKTAKGKVWS